MESSLSSSGSLGDFLDTEYGIRILDPDGVSDGSHTIIA